MHRNSTPIMSIEQREMLAQDLLDLVKDLKWNERIRLKSYSIEGVYRLQSGAVATIVSQKIQKLIEIVKYILTSEKLQQYSLEIETNTLPDGGSETVIYIKRYIAIDLSSGGKPDIPYYGIGILGQHKKMVKDIDKITRCAIASS